MMGETVICARVAVQLAKLEYSNGRATPKTLGVYPRVVLQTLPLRLSSVLRLALHSLGIYLDLGFTGKEWLHSVLEAAHYGHNFRRCFFFDYKEQRRAYPRVTNRGVQTSPPHTSAEEQTELASD
jgi:hypothetical protein